ncbi:MAG TPA: acetyltransferase [Bryobacteraceae bacterium]|jgi:hypothetical protein|nr:acetyltransferase [Bryobacteraceae bacterium]
MAALLALAILASTVPCSAQRLLRAPESGEAVNPLPSDVQVLESEYTRKDLPCSVTQRKPELGFDLRFHTGFDVRLPMVDLAGDSNLLTIVFRVYPQGVKSNAAFFVQHFTVPAIEDDAKGDAFLQGGIDVGEGAYHVDWLMRDRSERYCSSSWDVDASLSPKDKPIPLFLGTKEISESLPEPFVNDPSLSAGPKPPGVNQSEQLNLKILVNFAPELQNSASLQRNDLDALVTILKSIERDRHIAHISLLAFNMNETRIVYRQDAATQIDFPALGKALQTMRPGTVNLQNLAKHSEADFLEGLIESEVATTNHPDAVIFAGPKAMLEADVPQQDLRRIGDIECPVFYLNYNLDPQATPWKDSISHAIHAFRGMEFTISRPRDVWFSTVDVLTRISRSKRERAMATVSTTETPGRVLRQ